MLLERSRERRKKRISEQCAYSSDSRTAREREQSNLVMRLCRKERSYSFEKDRDAMRIVVCVRLQKSVVSSTSSLTYVE